MVYLHKQSYNLNIKLTCSSLRAPLTLRMTRPLALATAESVQVNIVDSQRTAPHITEKHYEWHTQVVVLETREKEWPS